jgi:hypothetical protein
VTFPGLKTAVRITMFKSAVPFNARNPIVPEYTPRAEVSSLSRISMVRIFGAPVIDPPGNALRMQSTTVTSSRSLPRTVLTS